MKIKRRVEGMEADAEVIVNISLQMVSGNATGDAAGAVHKVVKRKYRQYMNRKGGFNRPLDECK